MNKYEKAYDIFANYLGKSNTMTEEEMAALDPKVIEEALVTLQEAVSLTTMPQVDPKKEIVKEIIDFAETKKNRLILVPDLIKELRNKYLK